MPGVCSKGFLTLHSTWGSHHPLSNLLLVRQTLCPRPKTRHPYVDLIFWIGSLTSQSSDSVTSSYHLQHIILALVHNLLTNWSRVSNILFSLRKIWLRSGLGIPRADSAQIDLVAEWDHCDLLVPLALHLPAGRNEALADRVHQGIHNTLPSHWSFGRCDFEGIDCIPVKELL